MVECGMRRSQPSRQTGSRSEAVPACPCRSVGGRRCRCWSWSWADDGLEHGPLMLVLGRGMSGFTGHLSTGGQGYLDHTILFCNKHILNLPDGLKVVQCPFCHYGRGLARSQLNDGIASKHIHHRHMPNINIIHACQHRSCSRPTSTHAQDQHQPILEINIKTCSRMG